MDIKQASHYKKITKNTRNDVVRTSRRFPWLDALRGLCVISMVFYHYMWDVVNIYNGNFPWYNGTVGFIWQQSICWSFIIISGFSLGISKHPIKRGGTIFLCGAIITVVTVLFFPELSIWFGVLTFIGSAILIVGFLRDVLLKLPGVLGIVISLILFVLTRGINKGFFTLGPIKLMAISPLLYKNYFTTFFGFPFSGFYSTDYFSFFPWIFLFLIGFYMHKIYSDNMYDAEVEEKPVFIIGTIGRHSLLIYILHQPVIYGLLYVIHRFLI